MLDEERRGRNIAQRHKINIGLGVAGSLFLFCSIGALITEWGYNFGWWQIEPTGTPAPTHTPPPTQPLLHLNSGWNQCPRPDKPSQTTIIGGKIPWNDITVYCSNVIQLLNSANKPVETSAEWKDTNSNSRWQVSANGPIRRLGPNDIYEVQVSDGPIYVPTRTSSNAQTIIQTATPRLFERTPTSTSTTTSTKTATAVATPTVTPPTSSSSENTSSLIYQIGGLAIAIGAYFGLRYFSRAKDSAPMPVQRRIVSQITTLASSQKAEPLAISNENFLVQIEKRIGKPLEPKDRKTIVELEKEYKTANDDRKQRIANELAELFSNYFRP